MKITESYVKHQDSTKTILQSVKHFFSGTLLSRLTGLGREVMMAAAFGTSPSVSAFWMAFRFAYLLRRLLGEGALHSAFVPHFEMLREKDSEKAARFFYDLTMGLVLLLLAIVLLGIFLLGSFSLFGSLSDSTQEILHLTMLLLPALVFISLYALNNSLLNCERYFFLPSVAPAFLNLIWIGAAFYIWKTASPSPMEKMAMILVMAFAIQWGVTLPHVYRYLKKALPKNWWKIKHISGREILALLNPFLLGVIGVAATQINSACDAIFARIADPQGPAFLWYAIRIQQLPLALFGVGFTGALLPPISRAIQRQDWQSYHQFFALAFKRISAFMIPITIGIFVLGFSGINLIYGHGEFSQEATLQTTFSLWAYGAGLWPMTLVLIFAASLYAFKNYKTPALISVGMVLVNIFLNGLFVFGFKLGAVSIALATTISSLLQVFVLGFFLNKESGIDLSGALPLFLKLLIASLVAAGATFFIGVYVFGDGVLSWLLGKPLTQFPRGFMEQLKVFTGEGIVFGSTLFLMVYLFRIRELLDWIPSLRKSSLP